MIKEAIEIDKCPANFNGEEGWKISNTWKLIIYNIKRTGQGCLPSNLEFTNKQ